MLLAGIIAAVALPGGQGPAGAQAQPPTVLEPVTAESGLPQQPDQVAARIDRLAKAKVMGKTAGTVVMDAVTGEVLYDDDASTALIPASTNKITTSVGVLSAYGGDKRLTTSVTRDGGTIYLVGGGDPLLASRKPMDDPLAPPYPKATSMQRLATEAAASLKAQGATEVQLRYDDTLFSGPSWGPEWPEYFRGDGIVSPVSALIVDDGRVGGLWGVKVEDPARAAAERFAELLRARGIKAGRISAGKSPSSAQKIAAVDSVPVHEVVGEALTTSDNDTAEMLFRLAGVGAGYGGSFEGGGRAVRDSLESLGISTVGATFADGSGLSKQDRIPPKLLAQVLRRSLAGEDGLWPVASGLPVAAVTGTLRFRFDDPQTESAAGWVRGKTGTLNYVSSLAGFVQSDSGRVLVFASIANEAKSSGDAAANIDKIAARVAGCGCPGGAR
jgi:D-alanyl-D-alanine carboxypeptidase/D-alanyl-D-alanine-endopeptidase (penicillin-binding protein 4)